MLIDLVQITVKARVFNSRYIEDGIPLVNHEGKCTKRAPQNCNFQLEQMFVRRRVAHRCWHLLGHVREAIGAKVYLSGHLAFI
jgi:hypothetical protein